METGAGKSGKRVDSCLACRQDREGQSYSFFYGRSARGSGVDFQAPPGQVVTAYDISPSAGFLCDECVRKRSRGFNLARALIWGVISMIVAAIFAFMLSERIKGDETVPLWALIVLGVLFLFFLLAALVAGGNRKLGTLDLDAGQSLAIETRKNELKAKGYDTFWPAAHFPANNVSYIMKKKTDIPG